MENRKSIKDIIINDDRAEPLNHTRSDELQLKEYLINRDHRAVDYGMQRFNPLFSGTMSKNPHTQWIYMAVGNITLLTRYAMDGGMPESRAYAISDTFLQMLNQSLTVDEITEWYRQALTMFVSLMPTAGVPAELATFANSDAYSPLISQAINYCINNIYRPLSVKSVSYAVHVSSDYLSFLFHKETGITFSIFIRQLKIEAAKELMRHTNLSGSELAYRLGYCSQSYFIKVFKEETSMTPEEYAHSIKTNFNNDSNSL